MTADAGLSWMTECVQINGFTNTVQREKQIYDNRDVIGLKNS